MTKFILPCLAAIAFAANIAVAEAQDAKGAVSSDQIIHSLTPPAGTPPLRFRGLHLLSSEPAATTQMPAVGLDIKFKVNSAMLTDDAKGQVRQLADAIKSEQLSKYHFLIEGHTDSSGRPDYNMSLSKRRAQAVKDYMVAAYGVPRSRLEAVGRGQTMPIKGSDPADPANRRVQVVNIGQ